MTTISTDEGYSLHYGDVAPVQVRALLHNSARMHLQDVRAMLRLPLPDVGITAGCNFAAVHVLLNALSGLSRLLGPGPKRSDDAFIDFVRTKYPWSREPRAGFSKPRATEVLYRQFRNGFAHDLGLLLEPIPTNKARTRIRSRFRLNDPLIGVRKQPSLTPDQLVELDDVGSRPVWLGPTVSLESRHTFVDAVALYWGVRRLLYDQTGNKRAMRSLQQMIDRTWSRRKKAGLVQSFHS